MAILDVQLVDSRCTTCNINGLREYENQYQIKTDSRVIGPITVRDAPGIPSPGDHWSDWTDFDPYAFLTGYGGIQRVNAKTAASVWRMTVKFSTKPLKTYDEAFGQDPLSAPAIIRGGGVRFQEPVRKDKDGQDVVSSAGDFFDGLMKDSSRRSLQITKNFATIDLLTFDDYTDAVNSSTFFGLAARTWKLTPPNWEQHYYGRSAPYYHVTFTFEASNDYDPEPVDRGPRYKAGTTAKYFQDDEGIASGALGNLNGVGGKLSLGSALVYEGPFEIYKERDFANLDIPTEMPS